MKDRSMFYLKCSLGGLAIITGLFIILCLVELWSQVEPIIQNVN